MIELHVLVIIILIFILYSCRNKYNAICENFDDDFVIKDSKIHGKGVFSKKNFLKDSTLFKTMEKDETITLLGSKINHCQLEKTNSFIKETEKGWFLIASKDINNGDEILSDYNNTPIFIKKPEKDWKC